MHIHCDRVCFTIPAAGGSLGTHHSLVDAGHPHGLNTEKDLSGFNGGLMFREKTARGKRKGKSMTWQRR